MTYTDWKTEHDMKVKKILDKLDEKGLTANEVIEYFKFENMVEKEPNFCLLYQDNKKCHPIKNLNCLFCACPYFKFDENGLKELEGDRTLMSDCTINSKFRDVFEYEEKVHCDCTKCFVPHSKGFAMRNIKSSNSVNDSYSFLEYLRAYQLGEVLGKYKLF